MAFPLPSLTWIRSFEAAARHLGFAAAAAELNLTPAAVSQHIRALEGQLGVALFERLARGVALTPMGAAYLPSVRKALDDLAVATVGLFGAGPCSRLTVRSLFSFATLRLAPALPVFLRANPGLSLRLLSSVWSDGEPGDDLDVDIRYGDAAGEADALRLAAPVSIPVCPPGTDFGDGAEPGLRAALAGGAVHVMGCENLWSRLGRSLGWPEGAVPFGAAVDSSAAALEMVAAGSACAIIERDLAAGHVAAGRVTTAPGLELAHEQTHYAALPRRARPPTPAALRFHGWLAETFVPGA